MLIFGYVSVCTTTPTAFQLGVQELSGGQPVTEDDHVLALGDTAVAYHITGFPISMPWTTVEPVLEAIRNTRCVRRPPREPTHGCGRRV